MAMKIMVGKFKLLIGCLWHGQTHSHKHLYEQSLDPLQILQIWFSSSFPIGSYE